MSETCSEAILEISDGTTTINLASSDEFGFHLREWNPAISQYKGGGIFQDSPLAEGRRLALKRFENVIETINLDVTASSQDDLAYRLQEVRRLLEKASDYWATRWQNDPVWIHARSSRESNERWAVIAVGSLPEDDNLYSQPFLQPSGAAMEGIPLTLERQHWLETPPGEGVCVWPSAEQDYDVVSATNLVLNPGFETAGGGGADIWVNWTENAGTGALADVAPPDVHSGNHACRMTSGIATDTYVYQSFTVTPLTQFSFSFWTKGDGVNSGRYSVWDNTHSVYIKAYVSTGISVASYQQFYVDIQIPSGCVNIELYLICPPVAGGIAYFDDISLCRTFDHTLGTSGECPTGVEVLLNRGFEEAGAGGADLWREWTENAGTGAIADSAPHTGAHAAALTCGAGFNTWVAQDLTVIPGKEYTLSFWSKVSAGGWMGDIWIDDLDHGGTTLFDTQIISVTYQQGHIHFTPVAGCYHIRIRMVSPIHVGDTVWYDDLSFTYDPDCTCDDDAFAFVANKHNKAQITDIYVYDAAPGTWSDNLAEDLPAYRLLPVVPAAGDIVYFGCDTSLPDSGPFCSLVFNLRQALDDVSCLWEYYTGAAWATLTVQDNSNANGAGTGDPFDTAGVNSVHWVPPANWAANAINGVTAYWVRVRVTAVGASPIPSIQQVSAPYTIVVPFIEITAGQVPGDITALFHTKIDNESDKNMGAASPSLWEDRMLLAIRSLSRGSSFTPFINLSDEQNPPEFNVLPAGVGNFQNSIRSPSGRVIQCLNPAAFAVVAGITIDQPLAREYYGRFRCLLRVAQTSGATGVLSAYLWLNAMGSVTTPTVYIDNAGDFLHLMDFGYVDFPLAPYHSQDNLWRIQISIYLAGNGAADCELYDLILFPADEWCLDSWNNHTVGAPYYGMSIGENSDSATYGGKLDISSIGQWKGKLLDRVLYSSAEYVSSSWLPVNVESPFWQANTGQRLWMLSARSVSGGPPAYWHHEPELARSVRVWRQSRYLSMRGAR